MSSCHCIKFCQLYLNGGSLSSVFLSLFWGQMLFSGQVGRCCVLEFLFFLLFFFMFWLTFLLLGTIAITSVPLFMFLSMSAATLMIDIHRFPFLNVFIQGVRFEYMYIFFLLLRTNNGVIVVPLCTISVTKIFEGLLMIRNF